MKYSETFSVKATPELKTAFGKAFNGERSTVAFETMFASFVYLKQRAWEIAFADAQEKYGYVRSNNIGDDGYKEDLYKKVEEAKVKLTFWVGIAKTAFPEDYIDRLQP